MLQRPENSVLAQLRQALYKLCSEIIDLNHRKIVFVTDLWFVLFGVANLECIFFHTFQRYGFHVLRKIVVSFPSLLTIEFMMFGVIFCTVKLYMEWNNRTWRNPAIQTIWGIDCFHHHKMMHYIMFSSNECITRTTISFFVESQQSSENPFYVRYIYIHCAKRGFLPPPLSTSLPLSFPLRFFLMELHTASLSI